MRSDPESGRGLDKMEEIEGALQVMLGKLNDYERDNGRLHDQLQSSQDEVKPNTS